MERDVRLEGGHVLRPGQQKEIATVVQPQRMAHLRREMLQHADAFDRQPHVDFAPELMPHAARALACRALAEEFPTLQQQHVTQAAFGEVIRQAGTHDSAANDDHGCASRQFRHGACFLSRACRLM